jgi:hypothetical protein
MRQIIPRAVRRQIKKNPSNKGRKTRSALCCGQSVWGNVQGREQISHLTSPPPSVPPPDLSQFHISVHWFPCFSFGHLFQNFSTKSIIMVTDRARDPPKNLQIKINYFWAITLVMCNGSFMSSVPDDGGRYSPRNIGSVQLIVREDFINSSHLQSIMLYLIMNSNYSWRISSSGIWCHVVRWVAPDVSEDPLHNHRCENLKSNYACFFLVVRNFVCKSEGVSDRNEGLEKFT